SDRRQPAGCSPARRTARPPARRSPLPPRPQMRARGQDSAFAYLPSPVDPLYFDSPIKSVLLTDRRQNPVVQAVVCLPTYNERENLEPMLRALGEVLRGEGRVLVVRDA